MATTVGSHSVASFTAPINGTSPIDANSVRNNDNTLRTSYVAHDADAGIHVQSSTLASRPAASAAGRKWVTADAGSYKLWYDDGARWHEIGGDAIELEVVAGEVLAKGDVVSVTGYNTGLNLATVAKYTGAAPAFGIANEAIGNGARGYMINTGYITNIKTDTFGATGTILYPAATGTFTSTKPTSGQYQVSAYVLRSNSTNGVLYVEFSAPRIVERSDNTASTIVLRDGSGNFAAGTITAALTGNSSTATALSSSRTFAVTGDVTGSVSSDLTGGASIATSIASGVIVNADINASAGIADTKLATISTAGKVSNSATTATSANTTSAIVARDGSGNFTAGTITANLTGNVTGNASTATSATSATSAATLTTPRTIWGQSFNGSGDVSGALTGVTTIAMSGALTAEGSVTAGGNAVAAGRSLVLNTAAGNVRSILIQSGGVNRLGIIVDSVAESGSDAGSNLSFLTYTDAGAASSIFSVTRAASGVALWSRRMQVRSTTSPQFQVEYNATNYLSFGVDSSGNATISTNDSANDLITFGVGIGVGGETASTTTALITSASATGKSSVRIPHGVAPTSPVDGDIWTTTAGLFVRINGATVGPLS